MKKLFSKMRVEQDAAFYKAVFSLALPLALQSLFTFAVTSIDSIMLGSLGEIPMSVSNIANQPFTVVSGILRGFVLGACVLVAQFWGKKDTKSIKTVLATSIRYSMLLGAVATVAVFCFPATIMGIFTKDQQVISLGIRYLQIVAFSYVLFGFSTNYLLALRSMENAKLPFLINVVSYSINILLDYAFIFGKFGLPQMGITGVAIGTLMARCVEFAICFGHMMFKNKKLGFVPRDLFRKDKELTKTLFKYGIPSTLSEAVFNLGSAAYAVVFGHLGTVAISANTIAEVVTRITQVMMSGISGASAVLIGKTIGEGDLKRAKLQVRSFNVLNMTACVISMVLLVFLKDFVISLYNVTPETKALAGKMVMMAIVTMVGRGFEVLYVCGILVGGGDTKYIFWYTTAVMWGLVMPAAFISAFVIGLAPHWVYLILKMDFVIKSVIGYFRTRGDKWMKEVTKEQPEQLKEA